VYNAIKWTAPNQGQQTIQYTTNQGITRVPLAYHGGVDWNESGDISHHDIDRFTTWVHEHLQENYCGPIVLDYERPWWKELGARSILPERLREILSIYIEGVQVATKILPNAQWGYWGFPLHRNTGKIWADEGLTVEPLVANSAALYPDVYDSKLGGDSSNHAENHISKILELAQGRMPVYVFVSPRYTGQGGNHTNFIPSEAFLKQANAAMKAVWIDADGTQHRIQGLIFWDSYTFTAEEEWAELDERHTYSFKLLSALVEAWKKELADTRVETSIPESPFCQYGLPEPVNSAATLNLKSQKIPHEENTQILPEMEHDRVNSDRVRSPRIRE
jgi:hypothetical protein